jgi:hypothetical protein
MLEVLSSWGMILECKNSRKYKFNFFTIILSTILQVYQFQIYCGLLKKLTEFANI